MRQTLRALAPTSFDDVAALVALYRPGPMAANMHRDYPELKNGRKELTYLHPDIEPDPQGHLRPDAVPGVGHAGGPEVRRLLAEEAGQPAQGLRQEDRALIAAEPREVRRRLRHRGLRRQARDRAVRHHRALRRLRLQQSHSYGYGLVAYQTAWLKAHYPVSTWRPCLTSVKDNKDKTAVYLAECRAMGIAVLPPDVNRSVAEFAPTSPRTGSATPSSSGMAAVRNVGEGLVERICGRAQGQRAVRRTSSTSASEGRPHGPQQAHHGVAGKGAPSTAWATPRQGLTLVMEGIVDRTLERRREREPGDHVPLRRLRGRADRSGWGDAKIAIPDKGVRQGAAVSPFEKEMLGLYVSDHPLMGYEQALARLTDCSISDIAGGGSQRRPCPGALGGGGGGTDLPADLYQEGRR